jgi:hypothetical protein
MDRAGVRAGPEDVGDQTLIRGLDTAFPFVRPGLSLSKHGRRSCDRPHSGYSGDGGRAFHLKADSDSGRSRTAFR